jgi:phosphatidylglycerophosphatase A
MKMWLRCAQAITSVCGVGYVPCMPGTAGSLVGLVLWYILPVQPYHYEFAALVVCFIVSIYASTYVAAHAGQPDPSQIVIDEVLGMWVALFFVPKNFILGLCAFALFRFFDIVKPFPVCCAERLPGGLGIVLDDIIAGLCTGALMMFFLRCTLFI